MASISVPPVDTKGLLVAMRVSPIACVAAMSAETAPMKSPVRSASCLKARWITPSASAAAAFRPSRSSRSPRRTSAPSTATASAEASERARPTTWWPLSRSSGMTAEAMWPEAPVTNMRIEFSSRVGYDTRCHHHSTQHVTRCRQLRSALMSRWRPDAQGRLMSAAIELFDEQGYEATTVAEIAERAGLTKRTFFRYFSDKREVLFSGSQELQRVWLEGVAGAPADATALAVVVAGLDPVAEMFTERHAFARIRSGIIEANPELRERELIKLQTLAGAIKAALVERGVSANAAILAAQAGVTVFHVAFAHWVQQDEPTAFRRLMDESLNELRSVTAA